MNCLMTAWHRHEAELRAWLRSRTGNPADADDLLQELFLKAMRQDADFCQIETDNAPGGGQRLNVWTNVFEELPG